MELGLFNVLRTLGTERPHTLSLQERRHVRLAPFLGLAFAFHKPTYTNHRLDYTPARIFQVHGHTSDLLSLADLIDALSPVK